MESKEGWSHSGIPNGSPGGNLGRPGDVNGDGVFDSSDLVIVSQAGEFEDDIDGNSTFLEGDWNGDGDFTTRDLVEAFRIGGYQNDAPLGVRAARRTTPLPSQLAEQSMDADMRSIPRSDAIKPTAGNLAERRERMLAPQQVDSAFSDAVNSSHKQQRDVRVMDDVRDETFLP